MANQAELTSRLDILEERVKNHIKFFWTIVAAGFVCLGALALLVYNTRPTVGGDARLVHELEAPKSPQQLQANLSTITAEIQTARVEGRRPNPRRTELLSVALSKVVEHNPDLSEAWSTTAELISYRSQTMRPAPKQLPRCDLKGIKPEVKSRTLSDGGLRIYPGFYLSNCSLKLEDVPPLALSGKELPKSFPIQTPAEGKIEFPLYLSDGEVIYGGGPITPNAGFVFSHCSFDIKTDGVPNPSARAILEAALKNEALIDTRSGD
jgi:hypothetical protein